MQMSNKLKIVNILIMNFLIAIAICFTAQMLATGKIEPKLFVINFILAYIISFAVGYFLPVVPWGIAFAKKMNAKPNTLKFGLLINLVVNFAYVLVNCIILTIFNGVILGGAPLIAVPRIMAMMFLPIYIVGFIVSFLWNKPAEKIARNICGE